MIVTQILIDEHVSILKVLEAINRMFNSLEDKTKISIDHVEQIVDYIKNFADKYHHLKEENVLFTELAKHGMSIDNGPIRVMLMEHDEGRNYVKNVSESIKSFKGGDLSSVEQIEINLKGYCNLLSSHIYKENNILYPMAENVLPESVKVRISEDFDTSIHNTKDNEYFDKYLKFADELSQIYS